MKKVSIALVLAASLAAATSMAAEPATAGTQADTPVAKDNVLGQSNRSNITTEEVVPTRKLSRSEARAARDAKDPTGKKKSVVARHLDLSGDRTTNPSPTMTDTKNSVTGNPGAQ